MKKTITIRGLLLAALFFRPCAVSAAPAPDFKIGKVLNGPVSKIDSLKDLKGKVVFLDFWATWCGPCVASMPHMNRLQETFKGEPVVFIAITDESEEKINAHLKTHEMKTWIGIDQKGSAFKTYKVLGRPDGYLIGKDGDLLARVFPAHLKEKDVRDAIDGKFEPRVVEWDDPKASVKQPEAGKTFFEIKISSSSGKRGMTGSRDKLELRSMPLKRSIEFIWQVEGDQVILDTQPVDSFNTILRTPPNGMEQGRELLKGAIQSAFNIRVTPEQKETEVYVLKLSTVAGAPKPKPGEPGAYERLVSYGGGELIGTGDMPHIARGLWASMDRPVLDETGLTGTYEFELSWTYGSLLELEGLLAKQGLLLTPARRTVEFLRVTPAETEGVKGKS